MSTPTFGHLNAPRGAVQGQNWVWEVATLSWVVMTQPGTVSAGSDGALLDGASSAIRATVKNYTNSKPLTVVTVDTNGDPVSAGGGTQYAEDTPATAAEIVTMAGVVRLDTRGSLVNLDGDRTELQVNAQGDLRVDGSAVTQPVSAASLPLPTGAATAAKQDTGNTSVASIDTKTPALGQALAAASSPVVLTAIQVAALTPPAAIAGFNLEATQLLVKAKTDNLDVLLSTRLKPADSLAAVTSITNVVHVDDNAGSLTVDGTVAVSGSVAVTGPLTDAQLRASAVPVTANAGTNLNTSALNLEATQALVKAKTDNLDVLLSTRLKPADTLAAVTSITNVVHVDDNAGSLTVDGAVAVTGSVAVTGPLTDTQLRATPVPVSGTVAVTGNKTNNNAAPGATNVGTLPAVATAVAPTYVEGNQVGLSTDLAGNVRISGSISASSSATATANNPTYTEAASVAFSQDLQGQLRVRNDAEQRLLSTAILDTLTEIRNELRITNYLLKIGFEGKLPEIRLFDSSATFDSPAGGTPLTKIDDFQVN